MQSQEQKLNSQQKSIFSEPFPCIAIIGKRRSGKTYLTNFLIKNSDLLSRSENFIIISPTYHQELTVEMVRFAKFWHIDIKIYLDFDDIDTKNLPKNSTIFIDDTGRIDRKRFKNMVYQSAHNKHTIIFLGQRLQVLNSCRDNFNYFFIFRYTNSKQIKYIYEELFENDFENYESFAKYMLSLEKHQSIMNYDDGHKIIIRKIAVVER